MAIVVIGSTIVLNGCADRSRSAHENQYLIDQKVLKAELKNPDYEWNGPTSVEDRIPNLHAAQALAYRGDSAAIVLFDAIDDPEIEIISIYDAISNLGIPADFAIRFLRAIRQRCESGGKPTRIVHLLSGIGIG